MEINKKNRLVLFIVFVGLFITSLIIYNMYNNKELESNEVNNQKYILLSDYSRFFTVNSCINKYIVYLQSKDVDSLLKVLDKDYVGKNNINSNNIFNYLGSIDGNNSFVSKKIFYEEISDQYVKYYVYGYISKETIDNLNVEKTDKYYIVTFDLDNQLFSIMPYSGEVFLEDNDG